MKYRQTFLKWSNSRTIWLVTNCLNFGQFKLLFKSETKSHSLNTNKFANVLFKVYNQQNLDVNDFKDIVELTIPILTFIGLNLQVNDTPLIINSDKLPVKSKRRKNKSK